MDSLRWTLSRLNWASALDIAIVTLVFFWFLVLIYQTRADQVLRGVVLLIVVGAILASTLQLAVLGWLLVHSVPVLLIAIPVIFQPELRKLLEQLGRSSRIINHPLASLTPPAADYTIGQIVEACEQLARQNFGALIVIERKTGLQDYAESGTRLDGTVSLELLEALFYKNSALHDGAVIIQGDRVVAAKCVLPLSDNVGSGAPIGTRHRAAIGISEVTDAIAVVVSEETGKISIANNGKLMRGLSGDTLRRALTAFYHPDELQGVG
ncbi:MAG TPA: diadenylate cyclase CdaA [Chloroflexota bacterium]|nr:diadenylate cyclase CdaA [Chloroflexota bacterium]